MKCSNCKRKFPDYCLHEMVVSDKGKLSYKSVCGICALSITNKLHGMKRTNFSPGSKAQEMLGMARDFIKGVKPS